MPWYNCTALVYMPTYLLTLATSPRSTARRNFFSSTVRTPIERWGRAPRSPSIMPWMLWLCKIGITQSILDLSDALHGFRDRLLILHWWQCLGPVSSLPVTLKRTERISVIQRSQVSQNTSMMLKHATLPRGPAKASVQHQSAVCVWWVAVVEAWVGRVHRGHIARKKLALVSTVNIHRSQRSVLIYRSHNGCGACKL